ncbi:MAG TPA: SDR family oxidoreductase [Kiloniellales bacterium]|nr:SDR family oxidoreductase [Kiloniellales bacterium]
MAEQMTALVTGATSGFGEATARRFVKEGHHVVITGRRRERLDKLTRELGTGSCLPLNFDVTDREACLQAVKDLPPAFSKLDVLVNNAGGALGLDPAQSANLDDWDTMVDVNIKGLLYMARAVLPGMIERGKGLIVNIGSVAGTYPYPGGNVYGASKSFVHQFSLNLRADVVGTGVRVTSLEPGLVETDFALVRFKGDREKAAKTYAGTTPMNAGDIADIIWWLATLPPHINVNVLEVMPEKQAFGPFNIKRDL